MRTAKDRREKRGPERLSRVTQVRWTDAQFLALEAIAERSGRAISAVVRDVVGVWLLEQAKSEGRDARPLAHELILEDGES